ncbi:MAG: NUDIX domain-containing protein [Chitinophagia bacterium]|nr:NUDIX domain-containing protein [Chitinophagia bacterium]
MPLDTSLYCGNIPYSIKVTFANSTYLVTNKLFDKKYIKPVRMISLNKPTYDMLEAVIEATPYHAVKGAVLVYPEADDFFNLFASQKRLVVAAGGVVTNAEGDVLMIKRKGLWDLPKGKLDPGETTLQCAERETIEETGIQNLKHVKQLKSSHYFYMEKEKLYLKRVEWFHFISDYALPLHPQAAEDITEARFIAHAHLKGYVDNSYRTIQDVLKRGKWNNY